MPDFLLPVLTIGTSYSYSNMSDRYLLPSALHQIDAYR
jgi:hypothetical protein